MRRLITSIFSRRVANEYVHRERESRLDGRNVPKLDSESKVFGIGLNKTGSNSLHNALQMLGFQSVHYSCSTGNIKEIIRQNHLRGVKLLTGIERYQAFSDWNRPDTNHLFKQLDRQYPGSKFILHTRELEAWLSSREQHVRRTPNLGELQKRFPKSSWYQIDKDAWRQERQVLYDDVFEYFGDRPEDLLVLDIPAGDGWEKLCPFLGRSLPSEPFPFENRAEAAAR
jgi:hypothetical protein